MSAKYVAVLRVLVLAGAIWSASCHQTEMPPPAPPPAPPIASACAAYCQHLRALGCQEGEPLPGGASCEKFCIDTETNGHDLHISCVLQLQSCAALQQCGR